MNYRSRGSCSTPRPRLLNRFERKSSAHTDEKTDEAFGDQDIVYRNFMALTDFVDRVSDSSESRRLEITADLYINIVNGEIAAIDESNRVEPEIAYARDMGRLLLEVIVDRARSPEHTRLGIGGPPESDDTEVDVSHVISDRAIQNLSKTMQNYDEQ